MKKLMMILGIAGTLVLAQNAVNGQSMGSDYRTALGVKFWPGAISVKHFVNNNRAIEGLGYFWDHGFRFTGLYEIHGDINGAAGLKWYVGPGAHVGWYNGDWYRDGHYYRNGGFSLGVDGVLGLDYKINRAPINLSLDVQPYFEIVNNAYVDVWGGLGIRYTF